MGYQQEQRSQVKRLQSVSLVRPSELNLSERHIISPNRHAY